jgi:hypothetical protein
LRAGTIKGPSTIDHWLCDYEGLTDARQCSAKTDLHRVDRAAKYLGCLPKGELIPKQELEYLFVLLPQRRECVAYSFAEWIEVSGR